MSKIIDLFTKKLDCYQSIDELPIYNWFLIHKTNDLTWLLKKKSNINLKQVKTLEVLWEKIYFEFLDTFGIPDTMRHILEIKRDIMVLKIRMLAENDRSLETFIEIKELELNQLNENNQKDTTGKVKGYVEKFMGFRLNEKEITVKDFYGYIEIIKESAKPKGKETPTNE